MVKVLRSFVRGPLKPYVAGFAEELLRQGYTRTSAEQHVCFIAHLDRWMAAEALELSELGASCIERCLTVMPLTESPQRYSPKFPTSGVAEVSRSGPPLVGRTGR